MKKEDWVSLQGVYKQFGPCWSQIAHVKLAVICTHISGAMFFLFVVMLLFGVISSSNSLVLQV